MPKDFDPRERAVEATRLLNSFLVDFIVGTRGLEIFDSPAIAPKVTQRIAIGLNRMAISHLSICLAKWTEFYRSYGAILPLDVRSACLKVHNEVISRGIVDFRNKVIGHIADDNTKRPWTAAEIDEHFNRMFAGNREDFLRWINNPEANIFPHSVVAITEHVRDRLRTDYGVRDDEIG